MLKSPLSTLTLIDSDSEWCLSFQGIRDLAGWAELEACRQKP